MRSIHETTNRKPQAVPSSVAKEATSEPPAPRKRPRTPEPEKRFGIPYSNAEYDPFEIEEAGEQSERVAKAAFREMADSFLLNSVWEIMDILDGHKEGICPPLVEEQVLPQEEIDAFWTRVIEKELPELKNK